MTDVEVRGQIHGMWASVAPGWEHHADAQDERAAGITGWLLDRTAPAPGDRVLELACGPGGVGLAAAPLVGVDGEVVLSDVAAEMAAVAGARAAQLGLTNVRTAVRDLESIDEPDASFDVVLCREGLMFAVDPRRAASEIARVLRPGGRAGIAVWGPPEDNPWLTAVLDAVGEHLGMTLPPPGVPGPFSLSDATELAAVLADGGLSDVAVDRVAVPYGPLPVDVWWARTRDLAGPVAPILAGLPTDAQQAIEARAVDAIAPYTTDGRVELPGLTLVAAGTRI
jgi:SAM-dependent methyltransferase